jgi:hypothetical protein
MPETEGSGGIAGWARYIPKQGTGVVGRLSTVAMVAFAAMGAGVYTMPGDWPKLAGIAAIGAVFLIFLFRLISYAEKNPLHASLEGGELVQVQLKQWEIAAKGEVPAIPAANVPPPALPEAPNEGAPQ